MLLGCPMRHRSSGRAPLWQRWRRTPLLGMRQPPVFSEVLRKKAVRRLQWVYGLIPVVMWRKPARLARALAVWKWSVGQLFGLSELRLLTNLFALLVELQGACRSY